MVTRANSGNPTAADAAYPSGGAYARAKRIEAGLSQRDVADRIGVSHVFLGEFERGIRATLKKERLEKLAEVIPGFSLKEYERFSLNQRPLSISLEDAPPDYQSLGLALARRIDKRDLKPSELTRILSILRGGEDEDE